MSKYTDEARLAKAVNQPPMWCNVHQQLEYGPGGPIGSKDHRPYELEQDGEAT